MQVHTNLIGLQLASSAIVRERNRSKRNPVKPNRKAKKAALTKWYYGVIGYNKKIRSYSSLRRWMPFE